jgi:hypothetical protein
MKRLLKRLLVAIGAVVLLFVALVTCHYFFLVNPSDQGI